MSDGQSDQMQQLLQRLLTRMDFIEHRLVGDARADLLDYNDQLQDMRDQVNEWQRARELEAQDSLIADTVAAAPRPVFGHRGPGGEAALPTAATSVPTERQPTPMRPMMPP